MVHPRIPNIRDCSYRKVIEKDTMNINRKVRNWWNFGCPRELKKLNFEIFCFWKMKSVQPTSFLVTIEVTLLPISCIREWINMNWRIHDWTLVLLKYFSELLSFSLQKYFKNSFCYGIKTNWSFKCEILGIVGPLVKNLTFFAPLRD